MKKKSIPLLIASLVSIFYFENMLISPAAGWSSPDSWSMSSPENSQPRAPAPKTTQSPQVLKSGQPAAETSANEAKEAEDFKNSVMQLKNKRDSEIAALVKQRNDQIQELTAKLQALIQKEAVKMQQEKAFIEQKMAQGQDMTEAQAMLKQEQQSVMQESMIVQQQVAKIEAAYNQQIQNLTQAYAQQFAVMQRQMSTER